MSYTKPKKWLEYMEAGCSECEEGRRLSVDVLVATLACNADAVFRMAAAHKKMSHAARHDYVHKLGECLVALEEARRILKGETPPSAQAHD